MSRAINLIEQKFGKLIAVKKVGNNKRGDAMWSCLCECGQKVVIRSSHLRSGNTKSCGCLSIEKLSQRATHGHNRDGKSSQTYVSWDNMMQRCNNPERREYNNYGGRGINVCDRWRKFANFLVDMGEKHAGLQLDRIDNDKGYCQQNCRWVTPKQNSRNKRSNHMITHCGETKCLAAWAEYCGVPNTTLRRRIDEYGWSVEKALTTSPRHPRQRKQNHET